MGGFSEDNLLCVDQRGFKTLIQKEAASFLEPSQLKLNSTVTNIGYGTSGIKVTLKDNETIEADYALVTFSVGVLQNDDVVFEPELPDWKQEAIQAITMVIGRTQLVVTYGSLLHSFRLCTQRSSFSSRTIFGSTRRWHCTQTRNAESTLSGRVWTSPASSLARASYS